MTSTKGYKFLQQCRLCRGTEGILNDIFGGDGLCRNLAVKINQCLPILVQKDDLLPKLLCCKCIKKVEQIHSFRKICIQSELFLEASLKEQQAFTLEPKCCLKEIEMQPQRELVDKLARGGLETIPGTQITKSISAGLGEVIITPIEADVSVADNIPLSTPDVGYSTNMIQIGQPGPDDYVLMKEESFILNSNEDNHRTTANNFVEFQKSSICENDKDILQAQKKRREILPQMWDVYEKSFNTNNVVAVTHRRYIISKSAFPCSLCGKCFSINQGICTEAVKNLQSVKSTELGQDNADDVPFPCYVCGKSFPHCSPLKRHLRAHFDYKLFACKLCGKAFNRKEHLSRHMVSHTGGRPYHCDICNKPFTRKEHLSRHRLSHPITIKYEDEPKPPVDGAQSVRTLDPLRPFTCESCGQGFARKEHLIRHQKRMHWSVSGSGDVTEELKPYTCSICKKNFTRKEHLVRHQRIHVREFILASSKRVSSTDISLSVVIPN